MKLFHQLALAAAFCVAGTAADTARLVPLTRAHAHNDYLHERPLADALSHGLWSVEADVWLTNRALLVAHDFNKTSPDRTLQKLYLDPLRAFVKTNAAMRGAPPITLLIDVKSEAETTWAALREILKDYPDILRFDQTGFRRMPSSQSFPATRRGHDGRRKIRFRLWTDGWLIWLGSARRARCR